MWWADTEVGQPGRQPLGWTLEQTLLCSKASRRVAELRLLLQGGPAIPHHASLLVVQCRYGSAVHLLQVPLLLRVPLYVEVNVIWLIVEEHSACFPASGTWYWPQTGDHSVWNEVPIIEATVVQGIVANTLDELLLLL